MVTIDDLRYSSLELDTLMTPGRFRFQFVALVVISAVWMSGRPLLATTITFNGLISTVSDDSGGLLVPGQTVEFTANFDETVPDTNPSASGGDFINSLQSVDYDVQSGLVTGTLSFTTAAAVSLLNANVACDDMSCSSGSESLIGIGQNGTVGSSDFQGFLIGIGRDIPPVSILDANDLASTLAVLAQPNTSGAGSVSDATMFAVFDWEFVPVPEPACAPLFLVASVALFRIRKPRGAR